MSDLERQLSEAIGSLRRVSSYELLNTQCKFWEKVRGRRCVLSRVHIDEAILRPASLALAKRYLRPVDLKEISCSAQCVVMSSSIDELTVPSGEKKVIVIEQEISYHLDAQVVPTRSPCPSAIDISVLFEEEASTEFLEKDGIETPNCESEFGEQMAEDKRELHQLSFLEEYMRLEFFSEQMRALICEGPRYHPFVGDFLIVEWGKEPIPENAHPLYNDFVNPLPIIRPVLSITSMLKNNDLDFAKN